MMGKNVMRLRKHFDKEPEERNIQRVRSKNGKASIAPHRLFVPMLTVWGAALLGLVVIVLPASATDRIAVLSGLSAMGGGAKTIFAGIAALLGGSIAYVIAAALRARLSKSAEEASVVSAVSSRRKRTIDPAADLGSESLDAPLEKMPFGLGDELAQGDERAHEGEGRYPRLTDESGVEDFGADETEQSGFTRRHFKTALIDSCEGATCEAAAVEMPESEQEPEPAHAILQEETQSPPVAKPLGRPGSEGAWSLTQFSPQAVPEQAPEQAAEQAGEHIGEQAAGPETVAEPAPTLLKQKPRALDLSEFAQLPGRNAVWVEEPVVANAPPSPISKPRAVRTTSALEKLRQTPPENLSLVQMVERFAAALQDHQQADNAGSAKHATNNERGRDAALAEALKALSLFTERGFDQPIPTVTATSENELGQTERELREALVKLQNLRGAA